jgi:triphosphoribosyl-dephospho-CoA synthase
MIRQEILQRLYFEACALDVQAFKPGNVSVYSSGHGMCACDFYLSAEVSAPSVCDPKLSLGERIYWAVEATQKAVGCNTNLGIVLLAAPLIKAVQDFPTGSVRERLRQLLSASTRDDAAWVYRAIRLAKPGGLGRREAEDVYHEPSLTLLEAMQLAKDYDRIAFNYAFFYQDIYELAIPSYHDAALQWEDERLATVAVFVALLSRIPDTHVGRKFGRRYTGMIQERMAKLAGQLKTSNFEQLLPQIWEVDAEFKRVGINPGTTADLTVAALLAVRLERLVEGELSF